MFFKIYSPVIPTYSVTFNKPTSDLYKVCKENNLEVKSITIDNGIKFEKIGLLAN